MAQRRRSSGDDQAVAIVKLALPGFVLLALPSGGANRRQKAAL